MRAPDSAVSFAALVIALACFPDPGEAQDSLPRYLRDRGAGIPASIFGTFIEEGQLLVFPYFGYSRDNNREYQPAALGFGLNEDFRARFRSSEGALFLGYGVTDWLALEFEVRVITATFEKSPLDPSATPAKIKESGLGDVEAQLRLRLMKETEHRPEIYGFLEMTPATQKHKVLIGEPNWDLKPGLGLVRGFSWGTVLLKLTGEYNREASSPDLGEVSLEYFRRLSPSLRLNLALEGGESGAPDEFELITGVHWRITDFVALKADNSFGLSAKATDWAPQIGVVVSFRP